jgi:hypothetical protein
MLTLESSAPKRHTGRRNKENASKRKRYTTLTVKSETLVAHAWVTEKQPC